MLSKIKRIKFPLSNTIVKYFSSNINESEALIESHTKKNTYSIIPIIIHDCLMPYGKTIKISVDDNIQKLLSKEKPKEAEYCVFFQDKKTNKISNIGIRCSTLLLISNGKELSITSKESESRVFADTSESSFFESYYDKLKESEVIEKEKNEFESIETSVKMLKPKVVVEYIDNKEVSSMIIDLEIAKNLISDINKVIFAFHDITSKKGVADHSAMRDVNAAIIFLQNVLKINMDYINTLNQITIQKEEENEENQIKEETVENEKGDKSIYNLINSSNIKNGFISSSSNSFYNKKHGKSYIKSKESFLKEINSLLYENIQEFLKLSKNYFRSNNFKTIENFLSIQDPLLRTKALTELIYDIGDYLIKDLFMLDEYKKDSIQKQEKYMLRYIKKQIDKIASGESAESYIKRLDDLYSKGDISEQVKRSIQLEIDLAFNSNIQGNETEFEDRKKYQILEDVFNFPWDKRQEIFFDVEYTNNILNMELFGLKKVKHRIDEYIAKLKRKTNFNSTEKSKNKGFVILITGPPGTGKTTVAQLIGKALKRKTGIINLSGETDAINLKGSRRTYIDSQPSIFFKEMVKLGVKNPVIILDEIDKIANKGDKVSHSASAALLELLNPEENHNFIDQYLNIPLDFSETIFICTSNYNVNILEPLLDRVEILEIDDYTFKEKKIITEKFLIPKTLEEYGLNKETNKSLSFPEIVFSAKSIEEIIKDYSYSNSGVRSIKRSIEKLIRKININIYKNEITDKIIVDEELLVKYLSKHKIADENMIKLIKNPHIGYLCADYYGNVGKIIIKKREISIIEDDDQNKLNDLFKNTTIKDIFSNITLLTKLSKPVKEALDISIDLARKKVLDLIDKGYPFDNISLIQPYSLYMTYPYSEKVGNSFGLPFYLYLVSLIFDFHPSEEGLLILGEVNPKGNLLRVSHLKYILSSCEYYDIKKVILPKGNKEEFESFIKNSDKKIDAVFMSSIDEAFNYVFHEYMNWNENNSNKSGNLSIGNMNELRNRLI